MVFVFFVILAYVVFILIYDIETQQNGVKMVLDSMTALCFLSVTIALTVVFAPLSNTLRELPNSPFYQRIKRDFAKLFFLFLVSYLLMTLTLTTVAFGVCNSQSYTIVFTLTFLELFPIHCVLFLHNVPQDDEEKKPVEIQQSVGFIKP